MPFENAEDQASEEKTHFSLRNLKVHIFTFAHMHICTYSHLIMHKICTHLARLASATCMHIANCPGGAQAGSHRLCTLIQLSLNPRGVGPAAQRKNTRRCRRKSEKRETNCSEEARRTTRNDPRVRARSRTDSKDDMLAFKRGYACLQKMI